MKQRLVLFICFFFVLMMAANNPAKAEMREGAFTLTPRLGGHLFDGRQDLENAFDFGLGLGYYFAPKWGVQVGVDTLSMVTEAEKNARGYLARLEAVYYILPKSKLVPYVAAGLGGIMIDPPKGGTDTDMFLNWGVGLRYFFKENWALQADLRHVFTLDETWHNLNYTVGLTYQFGGKQPVPPAPPAMPAKAAAPPTPPTPPKDSDNDNVPDNGDKCPDTPAGVKVDKFGCPLDSDKDGVPDYLDKCPDTPAGVKVDQAGCPLDSDKDRVPDYLDKCPDTPLGAPVNTVGCWIIKNINFDFDKYNIKPEFYPGLDEAVQILNKNPDLKIEIEGHTDSIGGKVYNQGLSEKRAGSVLEYFKEQGIDPARMKAIGYGLTRPVVSNDTKAGRAMNRRVELKPIR